MPDNRGKTYKKKGLLSNPKMAKKLEVVRAVMSGKTQSEVARERGVTRGAIYNLLNTEEAKKLIKIEQLKLVSSVPSAVRNIKRLVEDFQGEDGELASGEKLKLGYDASREVLRTAGMLPVPNNSQTTITQIIGQQNVVASPIVQRFLDEHVKGLRWEGDSVEGEVIENES